MFHILRENNPELAGENKPELAGDRMCRQPEHEVLLPFVFIFSHRNEYVICNGCKSPNTIPSKENMHSFLVCKKVESEFLNEDNGGAIEDLDDQVKEDEEGEGIVLQTRYPWEGTDRDYEFEELLGRVFNILRENNPELAGDRRRTVMRPPQVLREGTKKTVFVNFMDLCKTMHRQPEHVMNFLLAEMGTSGSLDGQQRLVVKGRFAPKNFEGILRRYVNEYVICNGCKSPDTILSKENRLFFLRCEQCGSGRSVAPIKAGFVARVGRRKAGHNQDKFHTLIKLTQLLIFKALDSKWKNLKIRKLKLEEICN
ncbi:hypothetical protein MKW98_010269 [Papaver atlanticum]|uniref:Eukaryotic translation initiation factor 2 subunit beta n=1 Tax=Papaver atlanticum TaxID=357466 RepID=A0AAD4SLZ3_9MAGN|nr:hypothetical protein MKW98_010269 [Papaver atlanticum]